MTGYRLPDATRLGAVRLQVADLERSLDFYQSVLGLSLLSQQGVQATLGAFSNDSPLVELRERANASPVPRRGRLGLYHFAILVPDRPTLGRFINHLSRLGLRPGMSDHLVSEAVYLTDPDGLGIEVYRDRPRSTWKHVAGQLAMATDPLDVKSVVESAGGDRWAGMPAGTTIGHVHFHVGDIDQAAAFYSDGLGMEKTVWNYPGALFMSAGGYHHHLGANTWAAGAARPLETDAQLLSWHVVVPTPGDASAVAMSLRACGYGVVEERGIWKATDPWGTPLRIVAG